MYNQEWLNKNAYEDTDGDYWKTQNDRDQFENEESEPLSISKLIYVDSIGKTFTEEEFISQMLDSDVKWAVNLIVTQESHPEYYLWEIWSINH